MERLTEDLVLRIFAGLEIHDLARLRCVCRSYHSAIASQEFAKLWKKSDQVCCVLRDWHNTQVWYPGSGTRRRSNGLIPGPAGCFSMGVASSHGLVCGFLHVRPWYFVVGNPLTHQWRRLPPIDIPPRTLNWIQRIHLQVDPSKGSYKLVLAYKEGDYNEERDDYEEISHACQYDSELQAWSSAVSFKDKDTNAKLDGSVLVAACISPFLTAYNPDSMAWSCYKLPPRNGSVYSEYSSKERYVCGLLRWNERIFMATHSPSCVRVWELDGVAGKWKSLSSRRWEGLLGMKGTSFKSVKVVLVESTVVFSDGYELLFAFPPFAYSLEDSTWHSSASKEHSDFRTLSFAFVPSFTIEP